ncbi:MAG: glycosyltransferase family 4 protein [Conexivisphaerales archaeon]
MKARICYLAPDVPVPSPRGSSVHVLEVSREIAKLGFEVHIICRRSNPVEASQQKMGSITLHRINRRIFLPETFNLNAAKEKRPRNLLRTFYYAYLRTIYTLYVSIICSRIVKQNDLHVIIERETAFGSGAISSLITGRPLILEVVGPRYSSLSARRSKALFYYTDTMLKKGLERGKCYKVSAGVNLQLFRPDDVARETVRSKLQIPPDVTVLGYVGTFQHWHGVDILLYALLKLLQSNCNVMVLLVGPKNEIYLQLAEHLGVSSRCIFVGGVEYEQVSSYINACDIMVAPYNPAADTLRARFGIGSPIKIFEYMACSKPVITSRIDPITRILTDGQDSLLVTPGDVQELCKAIEALVQDKERACRLGMNGLALVKSNYSWARVADAITEQIERSLTLN